MKRLLACSALTLLLVACANTSTGAKTVEYKLEIDVTDTARRAELAEAAGRVMERMVQSIGKTPENLEVQAKKKDPTVTMRVPDADTAGSLEESLKIPFSFRIMESSSVEEADVTIDETDASGKAITVGFRETGITEVDLDSIDAAQMPLSEFGEVRLNFTKEGLQTLQTVLSKNAGKRLGIFVRNRLISTMDVGTDSSKDVFVISNIPSFTVATIFADDVNVGLHVTFVPVE